MTKHFSAISALFVAYWIFLGQMDLAVAQTDRGQASRFVDHSLLIAPEYPCTWPSYPFPRFAIIHQRTIGPDSAYHVDTLLIDGTPARSSMCRRIRSPGRN